MDFCWLARGRWCGTGLGAHPVDEEYAGTAAHGWLGMLLGGGVAGAEPPHKGGPNRPDRPELQWSVVSRQ